MLDDFVIKKTLGTGSFGKVLLVETKNKEKYALKIIPFNSLEKDQDEKDFVYG